MTTKNRPKGLISHVSQDVFDMVLEWPKLDLVGGGENYANLVPHDLHMRRYMIVPAADHASKTVAPSSTTACRSAETLASWINREDRLGLTRRQKDVCAGSADGLSNREIAQALQIAEPTVEIHVKGLLRGLNVRNRTSHLLEASEQHAFCGNQQSGGNARASLKLAPVVDYRLQWSAPHFQVREPLTLSRRVGLQTLALNGVEIRQPRTGGGMAKLIER